MIDSRPAPRIRDDLNHRIELVSMDRWCSDITVALYLVTGGPSAIVHSYARGPEVPARLTWLAGAMRVMGGLHGGERTVAFACGAWHERAARRVFLEVCKLDPDAPVATRPLIVEDPRTNQTVTVTTLGDGAYRVSAVAADPSAASRGPAVAAGLAKLGDLDIDPSDDSTVRFACRASHDELVGVLLPRAINVRAALREQEQAAIRGILVAPSAQEGAGA